MLILRYCFGHADLGQCIAVLESELQKAREEAAVNADLIHKEKGTCKAAQSKVAEVEGDLSNRIKECNLLKSEKDTLATDVRRLGMDLKEARFQATSTKEELKQASDITSGKPYLLQSIFGSRAFPGLTQVWRLLAAIPDLPLSAEQACLFYRGSSDEAHE